MKNPLPTLISKVSSYIDDDWKKVFDQSQSFHLTVAQAAFWGAVTGAILVWPAFADVLPLWFYSLFGIVACAAAGVARFLKWPGADD